MKLTLSFFVFCILTLNSCTASETEVMQGDQNEMAELPKDTEGLEIATFAGGCFWCTEAVFERIKGVKYVISGYAGGDEENPTYKQVSYGNTTHAEAIQIYYNDSEKAQIESEIKEVETSIYMKQVATQVVPFEKFYPAEKYHQDYYPANQDNRYIQNVSKPKVLKFEKMFPELLKPAYKD
ncbi:MAG: peptide-methionine (S)-S-oxide reductase [Flavobacteriales bacterium]|nr:peptide-methionine (S)-S-oxide reductase [Flavobacteriales bacterium]